MPYYRIQDVKDGIGENGNSNNYKIRLYGDLADNFINSKLINIKDLTIPIQPAPEVVRDNATSLAIAYFFKFESGDTELADTAEKNIETWFKSTYLRPRFKARGPY